MCPREATSREHAPPRCLFPSTADGPAGINYRQNLITVPSCDEHNSERSRDDEYLLFALAGSYTSSSVGFNQFTTKVRRSFERSPRKATAFIRRSAPVQLRREGDESWEHGLQVTVDGQRLDLVLENCARAIYFYETGRKFFGPTEVITNFTMYLDATFQERVSQAFQICAEAFADCPARGDNPAVFWYRLAEGPNTATFYFCFYGDSSAMIRFKKIILAT